MCEIPSNVILADEFAELFDGFSIGSNDLTQLTLGVDRDSEHRSRTSSTSAIPAVKRLIAHGDRGAPTASGRKIGICGQAPSDHPDSPSSWRTRDRHHLAQPRLPREGRPPPRAIASAREDARSSGQPARAWHALPCEAVASQVGVDAVRGLPEAEAAARLARHGPNALAQPRRTSLAALVLRQLASPLRRAPRRRVGGELRARPCERRRRDPRRRRPQHRPRHGAGGPRRPLPCGAAALRRAARAGAARRARAGAAGSGGGARRRAPARSRRRRGGRRAPARGGGPRARRGGPHG